MRPILHFRPFANFRSTEAAMDNSGKGAALLLAIAALALSGASASTAQNFSAAEIAAMKADYKRPPPRLVENPKLVELGRLLFWDPRVSASGKTACVACHLPQ